MPTLEKAFERMISRATVSRGARIASTAALMLFIALVLVGAWSVIERLLSRSEPQGAAVSVTSTLIPREERAATATPPTDEAAATEREPSRSSLSAGERTTQVYRFPVGAAAATATPARELPAVAAGETRSDLAIEVFAIGKIEPKYSGPESFAATSSVASSDEGAIRFSVVNIGAQESGPWYYQVFLPVQMGGGSSGHLYRSEVQPSLRRGDERIYTVSTTNLKYGKAPFEVLLDPGRRLNEITRENNAATGVLNVPLD